MKRFLVVAAGAVLLAGLGIVSWAAAGRGTAKITVKGKTVTVDYGRPSLGGKTVQERLGELPDGGFWRLGANKSTTFTTSGDLKFGDVTVPKGEYSLWVQKSGDGYKLVFNKQHGQWGTDHDAAQDFASVALKEEKESKPADLVTITLENEKGAGELSIQWGDMELSTTFM